MVILTDDQQDWNYQPTGRNMLAAFQWLVTNNYPGDSLFLHYSGHGVCQFSRQAKHLPDPQSQEGKSRIQTVIVKVDTTTPFALPISKPKGKFRVILCTRLSSPRSGRGLDSLSYSIAATVGYCTPLS
jgi:Caspase domain